MIIEDAGIKGLVSDLAYLDELTTSLGFVRWQWEYTRATYDYKIEDKSEGAEYFLRFNSRAIEGRLESPYAILVLEDAYIGRATFPHGLDYKSPIPAPILAASKRVLYEIQKQLRDVLLVNEIMSKDCITIVASDSLYEAATKMREHDIGFIPVVAGKQLIGVLTDRDLAIRGYTGHHNETVTVGEVFTKKIRTIAPHTTVEEAAQIMADEQVRRLPVVENGELLGIITLGDLSTLKVFESEAGEALGRISLPSQSAI
ncbi:YugN family protein [Paenibacillus agricola]|uniref:CBS domain-containing protein n=1 Tax=Paenibacillus agricola TaxID=2716264 RepID=A0ABX0JB72_9BACL|nr:YugN family protein [Paenibacillus agricola]NHN33021.1 CBS domain-containing protein [Paenibacillus agricola]